MSKERLEEIKKHRDEAENSIDEYEFEKINFYNLHVDWLIEQAGRVQELESDSYNAHLERLLDRREHQNKRYREAIEVAIHNMSGDNLGAKYALGILEQVLEESE